MVNQQLLDYVKQQTQQGIPKETISSNLLSQGWQPHDIEDGFNAVSSSILPGQNPIGLVKPETAMWKIIVVSMVGVVIVGIVGGGTYFVSQKSLKSEVTPKVSNEASNQIPTGQLTETTTPTKQPAEQSQLQWPSTAFRTSMIIVADKLSSCTAYKTTFRHPFTGDMLEKEILGIVNGKCVYVEQMPKGSKMECKYTESERKAVAQSYKDSATAESSSTSVTANSETGETKTILTLNGKVVDNPLQEAMDSGVCVLSGIPEF